MSEAQGTAAPAVNPTDANPKDPVAQGQPAAAAGAPVTDATMKEAAREAIRKHKLKIDGQEIEVDDEELKRGYGHQKAANKILQEGKAQKKQAEEFIRKMKDKGSLFEVIQKLGHDPRKLAEEYLAGVLEEELMDPREKELKHTKTKLQQYEDLEKKQKEALIKKRDDELKKKFSDDYSKQFVEALKETNLPPTKAMVGEMAKYIHRAAKINFQMTAKEAAQLVKEDMEKAYSNLYGEADADTLVRLLGEQNLQKIRQHDTSRLKDPNSALKTPTEQGEPNQRSRGSGKRMTPQEWRDFNRK